MTPIAFQPDPGRRHWIQTLAGPLEIVCVMGASLAAAMLIGPMISPGLGEALGLGGGPRDLLAGARALALQFGAQYGVLAALALVFALLRGRRSARAYAIATPASPVTRPLRYGIVLGLVISVIPSLVFILQEIAPIGADTPIWAALRTAPWDLDFWIFMAVGSFLVVPLIEELGWRSYVMGRLLEGFGPGAALMLTTLLFALLHVQYLRLDAAMLLTFFGLLIASIGLGFATLRAGTIWPAVIAHVMINLPLSTELHAVRIALALLALIVFRKAVAAELAGLVRLVFRLDTLWAIPVLAGIAGLVGWATVWPAGLPHIAAGLGGLALAGALVRRSAWKT
ncbi:CPBP family intramembrane glutamic endopeptidase [Maricaulis sp.]|uniref:CPBP family intramembrane glutamic endopeptidase n=1 Tax=Maricaulis sp. TaxID=1486257 RepID=UPI0025C68A9C|nr:CPBP family intramembrane glutamic endopeptidase [Maricaulis sp.]